jgi:hypothetical protein
MKRFAVTLMVPVLLFSVALGQQTKVLTDNPGVASSLRLLEKWAAAPAPKPSPPDPAWNAYIGLYTDPTFWDVEVMLLDGKLYLYNHDYPPEENARGALVELAPEGPHTFRMTGEDATGDLVVFEMGPNGEVQQVKVGENYIFPKK